MNQKLGLKKLQSQTDGMLLAFPSAMGMYASPSPLNDVGIIPQDDTVRWTLYFAIFHVMLTLHPTLLKPLRQHHAAARLKGFGLGTAAGRRVDVISWLRTLL